MTLSSTECFLLGKLSKKRFLIFEEEKIKWFVSFFCYMKFKFFTHLSEFANDIKWKMI